MKKTKRSTERQEARKTQFQRISEIVTEASTPIMMDMLDVLERYPATGIADVGGLPEPLKDNASSEPSEVTKAAVNIVGDLYDHCRGNEARKQEEGSFYKGYSFFQSDFYKKVKVDMDAGHVSEMLRPAVDEGELPEQLIFDGFDLLSEFVNKAEIATTYPQNQLPDGLSRKTQQQLDTLAHLNDVAAQLFHRGMGVPQDMAHMPEKSRYMVASQILRERVNELVIDTLTELDEQQILDVYEHLSSNFLQTIQNGRDAEEIESANKHMRERVEKRQDIDGGDSKSKARMGYVGLGYGIADAHIKPSQVDAKTRHVAAVAENMNVHTYGMNHGVYNAGKSHNPDGSRSNEFALDAVMLREATNLHLVNLAKPDYPPPSQQSDDSVAPSQAEPILTPQESLKVLRAFAETNRELAEGQNLECCVHPPNNSPLLDYYDNPSMRDLMDWKQDRDLVFAGSLFGAALKAGMEITEQILTEPEKDILFRAAYHFAQNYQKANDASDQLKVAKNAETNGKDDKDQNFDVRHNLFTENIIALWFFGTEEAKDLLRNYEGTPEQEIRFYELLESTGANSLYWLALQKAGDEAQAILGEQQAPGQAFEQISTILSEEFKDFPHNAKLEEIKEQHPSSARFAANDNAAENVSYEEFVTPKFIRTQKAQQEVLVGDEMVTYQGFVNTLQQVLHSKADIGKVAQRIIKTYTDELEDYKKIAELLDTEKRNECKHEQQRELLLLIGKHHHDAYKSLITGGSIHSRLTQLNESGNMECIQALNAAALENHLNVNSWSSKQVVNFLMQHERENIPSEYKVILSGFRGSDISYDKGKFVLQEYGLEVLQAFPEINYLLDKKGGFNRRYIPQWKNSKSPVFMELFDTPQDHAFFDICDDGAFITKTESPESPLFPLKREIRQSEFARILQSIRSDIRVIPRFIREYEFSEEDGGKWRHAALKQREEPIENIIVVYGDMSDASLALANEFASQQGVAVIYAAAPEAVAQLPNSERLKRERALEKAGVIAQANTGNIVLALANNKVPDGGYTCIACPPLHFPNDIPTADAIDKVRHQKTQYHLTVSLDGLLTSQQRQNLSAALSEHNIDIQHSTERKTEQKSGKILKTSRLRFTLPEQPMPHKADSHVELITQERSEENEEAAKARHWTWLQDQLPSHLPEGMTLPAIPISNERQVEEQVALTDKPFIHQHFIDTDMHYDGIKPSVINVSVTPESSREVTEILLGIFRGGEVPEKYQFSVQKHLDSSYRKSDLPSFS